MAASLFAANDVVRLSTGGPDMLVEGPGTLEGQVWCTWNEGGLVHGGSFDAKSLIRSNGSPTDDPNLAKTRKPTFNF